MKKLILLTALFALCYGCDKEPIKPEETLAGSVSNNGQMEGKWSFDGVELDLSQRGNSFNLRPSYLYADSKIALDCFVHTGNTDTDVSRIFIEEISLLGKPGDVTFDGMCYLEFSERLNGISSLIYDPVPASVKGWIKRFEPSSRIMPPSSPPYYCDINIECEVDGKPLKLHITRINSY